MKYTIQVVITTDEGQTDTREIANLERKDLTPTTLGLTLADGKAILKALQEVMVERQMTAYLATQRPCTHCGAPQRCKGYHPMQLRTPHAAPDAFWHSCRKKPAPVPVPVSVPCDQDV